MDKGSPHEDFASRDQLYGAMLICVSKAKSQHKYFLMNKEGICFLTFHFSKIPVAIPKISKDIRNLISTTIPFHLTGLMNVAMQLRVHKLKALFLNGNGIIIFG